MNGFPFVSVILPIRNEIRYIRACLDSIFAQDYPCERFEVLAIDGMSDDGTREVIRNIAAGHPNLRLIDNSRRVVTAAMNMGIRNARGEYLVRTDAHAQYAADYISSCVAVAQETGAGVAGGHMRAMPTGTGLMAHAIMLAHYSPLGLGGGRFHDPARSGDAETVWLGCYRREVYAAVGEYEELLTRSEDLELNARVRKAGFRIVLSPRIKAYYFVRPTLKQLWAQRFADGRGVVHTLAINLHAPRVRHLAPLAAVVSLGVIMAGLLLPWRSAQLVFGAALFLQGVMYLGALVWFAAVAWASEKRGARNRLLDPAGERRPRPWAAVLLPAVFVTLHFSYGFGSLWAALTMPRFMRVRRAGQSQAAAAKG